MDFLRISKLLSGDYFAVPDYQRDYAWTNAQNSALIEDVFSIMREDTNAYHFFGAIVTIPYEPENGHNQSITFADYEIDNTENVNHIVDGQQRLTSFSILLAVLRDLLETTDDANIGTKLKKKTFISIIENYLHGTEINQDNNFAPRLILNGNTGKCFNNFILKVSEESYNKGLKGARRIRSAYSLFKEEILKDLQTNLDEKKYECAGDYYLKLIDTIKNKLTFVEIKCDKSSNAFQVFDSLNGKGLDLTATDRIKNIFLSWSPLGRGIQKWDALASEVGDDYLSGFFISLFFYNRQERISKNNLPNVFRESYSTSATNSFDSFFNALKEDGSLYGLIRKNKTENNNLNEILKDFNSLGLDQVFVLLFAVAKHYGKDILTDENYKTFASKLTSLIVRMQVCEKSMNKLDSFFSKCIKQMKEKKVEISAITDMISNEINSSVSDEQFKKSFAIFSPSENKISEFYCRHIEVYLRKEKGNRNPVPRNLTVEHIIPQTLDELSDWYGETIVPEDIANDFKDLVVENIGNKMLLFGDDNAAANNHNYQAKLVVYKEGKRGGDNINAVDTFVAAKNLVDKYTDKFNHEQVFERAGSLAEKAVKIWC